MNLRKSLTLFLLIAAIGVSAQKIAFKTPDYKSIKANIENKNSPLYYPKLSKRLASNDTLLTAEQYAHLYYGYTLQPSYNPTGKTSKDKALQKYLNKEKIEKKEYKTFVELATQSLTEFPFNLKLLNSLAYIHHSNGNEIMARKVALNFQGLLDVVLSSGDGVKCETGIHVITPEHEEVILEILQFESRLKIPRGDCDYHSFEKGKYKVPDLYFNVARIRARQPAPVKSEKIKR